WSFIKIRNDMKTSSNLSLIIIVLCLGCITEEETTLEVKLNNATQHRVLIKPFRYSVIDSSKVIELNYGDEEVIERTNSRGKSSKPVFGRNYFINVDSVQIWWDD